MVLHVLMGFVALLIGACIEKDQVGKLNFIMFQKVIYSLFLFCCLKLEWNPNLSEEAAEELIRGMLK